MNYRTDFKYKIQRSAPFFLYLFLKGNALKSAPYKVQQKRIAQQRVAKFIIESLNLSETQFMNELRVGLRKIFNTQKIPEALLLDIIQGDPSALLLFQSQISGIYGDSGERGKMLTFIINLITKLKGLFKRGKEFKEKVGLDDMPDLKLDFKDMAPDNKKAVSRSLERSLSKDLDRQLANGGSIWNTLR